MKKILIWVLATLLFQTAFADDCYDTFKYRVDLQASMIEQFNSIFLAKLPELLGDISMRPETLKLSTIMPPENYSAAVTEVSFLTKQNEPIFITNDWHASYFAVVDVINPETGLAESCKVFLHSRDFIVRNPRTRFLLTVFGGDIVMIQENFEMLPSTRPSEKVSYGGIK